VIFNDIGNVFDTPRHLLEGMGRLHQTGVKDCRSTTIPDPNTPTKSPCDFDYLVAAVGTGVHYKTPIGPVRIDFGYNLNPATFPVRHPTGREDSIPPHIETLRRLNIFFSIGQTF
jgi:outer membrane protein assembly factor BamA